MLQALLFSQLSGVLRDQKPQHQLLEKTPSILAHADPTDQDIDVDFHDISDCKHGEEILRQSEEHLRLVVQNMPVMMDAFDAEKNIIAWNRECERVTGYSAEEIIGNPHALELLYPDAAYREGMLGEHGTRVHNYRNWEWHITCKDGTVKTIAWSNISAEFPIPGWVTWGIGVDVTERQAALDERQQTEEALKTSQERLLLAQKVGKIGTFEWNLQTHKLIWTQELEALYGLAPGSFGGKYKDWLKAIHPDDRARAKQEVRCILTQGLDSKMEYRIIWPDGSLHCIASRARIFNDDAGKPRRMIGVNMDITERKQAEEALKESEMRFRVIFNQAAVGITLVALDGHFIQVNPAMCDITGYSRAELLQLTVQEISHPEEQQSDSAYLQRVIQGEINGYSVQKRFFCKNGSIVWVNVTVSIVWDSNGSPKYGIGIIEDISDRKHAEASQQFLVEASRLLAASLDYETT
jgi:PAS domain S-box-containing protein